MEKIETPDPDMELCYECEGGRYCIMCQGKGKISEEYCAFCGGQKWCIVCNGHGQLPKGTYKDLVARGLIKE